MDRTLARLMVLPVLTFFAFTVNRNFIHYSGENVSLLLLSASLLTLAVLASSPRRVGWMIFAAGMVVGALPFAKLQTTPLGAVVGVSTLLVLWCCKSPPKNRLRDCAIYVAGALLLPLFFSITTAASGAFEHMLHSYIVANERYAKLGSPFAEMIAVFPKFLAKGETLGVWFYFQLAAGMLLLIVVWMFGGWKGLRSCSLKPLAFSAVLLIAAVFCVIAPGRLHFHYLLLLIIPSAVWLTACAACFGQWAGRLTNPRRRQVVAALLVVWVVAVVSTLALNMPDGRRRRSGATRRIHGVSGQCSRKRHSQSGPERPAHGFMGRMYELFVETGMWSATRDCVLEYSEIYRSPNRGSVEDSSATPPSYLETTPPYFLNLYIRDFEQNRPPVFVDSVSPESFSFRERNLFGYETCPPLAALVDERYRLIIEVDGIRIFLRNDLATPASVVAHWEATRALLAQERESLRSSPDDAALLNNIAWVLATGQDGSIRNGAEAVELAQRAVQLSDASEPIVLGTLAAAYAENGQFSNAVQTAGNALELATKQHNQPLAESIEEKIRLYKANEPFRIIPREYR